MKLLRTLAVTFALYSRIPMPHFEWRDEDMKYSMSCFPWVGAVIGLVYYGIYALGVRLDLPVTAVCLLMTAVPLIITGGFHVDGFMDVSDALSSYRTREQKLEILKDPHIGAFAVIRLCITGLIYIASLAIVLSSERAKLLTAALAAGFFLARGLSALAVLTFRSARNEGMLFYEAQTAGAGRKSNLVIVSIWLAAVMIFIGYFGYPYGFLTVCAAVMSFAWYKAKSYKEFGGITGDTAGWFVTVCETAMAAAAAIAALIH
ncbi:MAG: adenosylcobinamide-GDP ribazoletransferase [Mogibacterium sp.]|nr:adenosylcobinamide-GDP ribazoletransferase [Mogibacterium sp.]